MRYSTVIPISLLAALSCSLGTAPLAELDLRDLPATVVLGVGERLDVAGVRVAVQSVTNDSRCPIDAMCVWQGNAVVTLVAGPVAGDGPAHEFELNTGVEPRAANALGLRFTLLSLAPAARAGRVIRQDRYQVELLIQTPAISVP